mmetsp:Transcript_62242/g.126487  ORF Transcript_62242/g.126487 Transcript_62242/m.126487 type:complete len:241 (-) Transcript_62242:366-1088(-)
MWCTLVCAAASRTRACCSWTARLSTRRARARPTWRSPRKRTGRRSCARRRRQSSACAQTFCGSTPILSSLRRVFLIWPSTSSSRLALRRCVVCARVTTTVSRVSLVPPSSTAPMRSRRRTLVPPVACSRCASTAMSTSASWRSARTRLLAPFCCVVAPRTCSTRSSAICMTPWVLPATLCSSRSSSLAVAQRRWPSRRVCARLPSLWRALSSGRSARWHRPWRLFLAPWLRTAVPTRSAC